MNKKISHKSKIGLFYNLLQLACLVAAAAQIAIAPDAENLIATMYCAIGVSVLLQYLIRSRCAETHPLSSLALIGLCLTSLLTSLLAMSFYWRPLIQDLRAPELTFPVLASVQIISVFVHWVYRHFRPLLETPYFIANKLLKPIGAFSVPHVSTIWVMGIIGAGSQVIGHAATGDVGGKAVQALGFLCWTPFLIPFYYTQIGERFCNIKKQTALIALFIALMVLVGLARNVRQLMMIGPMQLAFAYFIYVAINRTLTTPKTARSLIFSTFIGAFALYGVADLTTAMGVAREKRDTGTYEEVISETFNALFTERHKLDAYRSKTEMATKLSVYDESYIPNPVLIRLSETKFHDNMLFFGSRYINEEQEELLIGMKNKAISALPETLSKIIFKGYDKNDHVYSMGDYYLYLLLGERSLSSFVTGSIWADFYTLFGFWYIVAIAPYILLMFLTLDSLSLNRNGVILISAVGICTTWPIFIYGIGGESIASKFIFLVRELPQRLFLYLLILQAMRVLQGLFGIEQPDNRSRIKAAIQS